MYSKFLLNIIILNFADIRRLADTTQNGLPRKIWIPRGITRTSTLSSKSDGVIVTYGVLVEYMYIYIYNTCCCSSKCIPLNHGITQPQEFQCKGRSS